MSERKRRTVRWKGGSVLEAEEEKIEERVRKDGSLPAFQSEQHFVYMLTFLYCLHFLSIYPSICLSIYLFVYLSIYLSICLRFT